MCPRSRARRLLFGIVLGAAGRAFASCGSATCPIDTTSAFQRSRGWAQLGYDFEYLPQNQPRIGTRSAAVGEIAGHHDEVYTYNRVHRWALSAGLTDRLSFDLFLPFIARSHQHIHHHEDEDLRETWDFTGIGDLAFQLRYAFYKPAQKRRPTVSAIAGAKFPTGRTDVTNEDGDSAEPTLTPGSGSYDALVGLSTLQVFDVRMPAGPFGEMPFFTSLNYKINGRGIHDYRIGNQLLANAGAAYPFTSRWSFLAQLNLRVAERDERGGTIEETDKTGGEYLYLSPGLEWRLFDGMSASALIQLPVYQRVNQIQLTSRYNVLGSLRYRFHLGAN